MRNGARRGLVAGAVVLAFLGTLAVQSTVAAWTDPAHVRATASAGTWVTAPVRTCVIERKSGTAWVVVPTATCQVVSVTAGTSWGSPVTHRQVNVTFAVVNVPTGNSHRMRADVDLTGAIALGPGQTWATSTVSGWGVLSGSPLPVVRYDFGNSFGGTQTQTAQATVVSG